MKPFRGNAFVKQIFASCEREMELERFAFQMPEEELESKVQFLSQEELKEIRAQLQHKNEDTKQINRMIIAEKNELTNEGGKKGKTH